MSIIETGTIQNGSIAFDRPLPLRDGQKVIVSVEAAQIFQPGPPPLSDEEFRALPFFGEWADRTDLGTSVDYVREERAKWSRRCTP